MDDLTTTELFQSAFAYANGQISPDGRLLAYSSTEERQEEIYVRPFPNVNDDRVKVSQNGGFAPRWAGNELFYQTYPGGERSDAVTIMAVQIDSEPTLRAGNPTPLFTGPYRSAELGLGRPPTYDVSADGQRLLMISERTTGSEEADIVLVQNWFEELKRLVPVP